MLISIFLRIYSFIDWIKELLLQSLSAISLLITYLLGIGLTRLVAALVGKKFLPPANVRSQWNSVKYSDKTNNHLY